MTLLSACGGETTVADGGILGTGSSVGPVSGFGSVFVNGVEFFTDGIKDRKVISNDGINAEEDLHEGMILQIEGEWQKDGTGTAKSMEYDDTLRGRISKWTPSATSKVIEFEIHKQPVFADAQTVFEGKPVTSISDGDFVRISGWRQTDGRFRASYIGVLSDADIRDLGDSCYPRNENHCDLIEVEGPVDKGLLQDTRDTSFTMNGLTVQFDSDAFADDFSEDALKEAGAYVEVEGDLESDVLVASRIQRDDFRRYQKSDGDVEIAGSVTSSFDEATSSFGLNDLTVLVTNDDPDDIAFVDLKKDVLVQVEGEFVAPGVIQASEIELREGDAEIEGDVDGNCGSYEECLLVGGVQVQVTPRTIITDDDSDDNKRLKFDDLFDPAAPPGAKVVSVEVSGLEKKREDTGQTYVEALLIERELSDEAEETYELEGSLEAVKAAQSMIKVLGVEIYVETAVLDDSLTLSALEKRLLDKEKIILEVEYRGASDSSLPYQYEAVDVEED